MICGTFVVYGVRGLWADCEFGWVLIVGLGGYRLGFWWF